VTERENVESESEDEFADAQPTLDSPSAKSLDLAKQKKSLANSAEPKKEDEEQPKSQPLQQREPLTP
jgi:hypothetical protein